MDGLSVLKKNIDTQFVYFGVGHDPIHSHKLKEQIAKELELSIISVY